MLALSLTVLVISLTSRFSISVTHDIYARTTSGDIVSQEVIDEYIITNQFEEAIAEIISFPQYTIMYHIQWRNGYLTLFPDLQNVSGVLTEVTLNYNQISYIPVHLLEYLDLVTLLCIKGNLLTSFPTTTTTMNLQAIYLDSNPIEVMPDFGTVTATLKTLSMYYTDVSVFSSDLTVFAELVNLNLKYGKLTDIPPCQLLPKITESGMQLQGNPIESFDTANRDFSCFNFDEGFNQAQFTSIPNLCKMSNLPAIVEWSASESYTTIDCDCSALWLKVNVKHISLCSRNK